MNDDLIEYALAVDLIECVAGINEDGYPARIPAKLSQSFAEGMDSCIVLDCCAVLYCTALIGNDFIINATQYCTLFTLIMKVQY